MPGVPNTFANASGSIPLSQLDANFNTTLTIGTTSVGLGNTISTISNVAISTGSVNGSPVGNVTPSSGAFTTLSATGNVTVADGTVSVPAIAFTSDTDSGIYRIGANNIGIGVNGAKVLDVATTGLGVTGAVTPTGLVDISGAAAGQIKFPATQNASSNANTLDDYEEGTWTGNLLSNGGVNPTTPITATGYYTKVGNLVYVTVYFDNVDTTGASGSVKITGLPFTATQGSIGTTAFYNFNASSGVGTFVEITSSGMYPQRNRDASSWADITFTAGAGRYMRCSGMYYCT